MNRHDRRRQEKMRRNDKFFSDYVRHLPEADAIDKPGVYMAAVFHDDWCGIYSGKGCNCEPYTRLFAEPKRS